MLAASVRSSAPDGLRCYTEEDPGGPETLQEFPSSGMDVTQMITSVSVNESFSPAPPSVSLAEASARCPAAPRPPLRRYTVHCE